MKSSLCNKIKVILAVFCLVLTKAEAQFNNNSLYSNKILDTVFVINFDSLILTPTPKLIFHCRVPSSFCGHTLRIPLIFESYNKISPTVIWGTLGNAFISPSSNLTLINTADNSKQLVISQPPMTDCKKNRSQVYIDIIWSHDCLDITTRVFIYFHYYD
jgi:hypothetical protein